MYPILKFDSSKIKYARMVDTKFLFAFIKIVLCVQVFLYIIITPAVFKAILNSNIGELRNELYDEAEIIKFPFYAANLLCRLYMGARNICIIIACYALLFIPERRGLIKLFFVSSYIFPLYIFTAYVSRAVMMQQIALSIFLFLLFNIFMQPSTKRKVTIAIIAISVPIVIVFNIISQSRFGNMASYMLYRYLGEAFNNYNTQFYYNLSGNTYGSSYLTLFTKILGVEKPWKSTREKWEWLDSVTGVDTHVFYTFIGGMNIEFGFVLTIIIGIALTYLLIRLLRPYNILTLPKCILLGMLGYTMINGAFFFVLQGDWGNLEICFTIFLYILFKKHQSSKFIIRQI